jgi:hypothetical protein
VARATDDGDIVVDVGTFTHNALRDVANALVADGFDSAHSPEGIVRFMKRDAKIDLLAPDGLGADPVETARDASFKRRAPRTRSSVRSP